MTFVGLVVREIGGLPPEASGGFLLLADVRLEILLTLFKWYSFSIISPLMIYYVGLFLTAVLDSLVEQDWSFKNEKCRVFVLRGEFGDKISSLILYSESLLGSEI